MTYSELDTIFPGHYYFYLVNNMDISEALDKCGRLSRDAAQVIQYQGAIVFASTHAVSSDVPFLTPVAGNPE
jgi:hypothetical protein